jgi:hypothetical protein
MAQRQAAPGRPVTVASSRLIGGFSISPSTLKPRESTKKALHRVPVGAAHRGVVLAHDQKSWMDWVGWGIGFSGASRFPSPLVGEGLGRGGLQNISGRDSPPPLTPPHKGEGNLHKG